MAAQTRDGRQPESAAGHDVAAAVKDFYERYPYPRPIDDLDNYRRRWQDRNRRRADFHLFWPDKPYTEERTILIAGCGTSQAAKHAARCPAARVVGIDFSATSVRHTEDLRRKYDLTNLEVHQLPIDRVGDLEMTFDEIVCTGVLHHLANPEAALRASARRARPGRGHAPHGVCAVRTGGHLHAAGVLPPHRHPGLRRRDPRSRRRARRVAGQDIRWHACCMRPRTSGKRRRWPTPCCIRRIARIQCRSFWTSSAAQGSRSAAGSGRRRTALTAA